MKNVLIDLIKVWGVEKVLNVMAAILKRQGSSERILASDITTAVEQYRGRK